MFSFSSLVRNGLTKGSNISPPSTSRWLGRRGATGRVDSYSFLKHRWCGARGGRLLTAVTLTITTVTNCKNDLNQTVEMNAIEAGATPLDCKRTAFKKYYEWGNRRGEMAASLHIYTTKMFISKSMRSKSTNRPSKSPPLIYYTPSSGRYLGVRKAKSSSPKRVTAR